MFASSLGTGFLEVFGRFIAHIENSGVDFFTLIYMNGEQVNNSHVEGAVGSAVLSALPGDEQGVIAVMAR